MASPPRDDCSRTELPVLGSGRYNSNSKKERDLHNVDFPGFSDEDMGGYPLPLIGSRNARWWYSTFHNVTAIVGAGVLALPSAMTYLGWGAGTTVLVLSWGITLYTLWQLVEMHEMAHLPGKRFDRYHQLGQDAFGPRLGLWIVVPQQLIVEVGLDIVYMLTGGRSLLNFYKVVKCDGLITPQTACDRASAPSSGSHCRSHMIGSTAWIAIFASQHFLISQLPNLNAIAGISVAAAVMSISYSTIAWADTLSEGRHCSHDYYLPDQGTADLVYGVFNALGIVAFAYAGHNVCLEIQSTLPSTPEKPSKIAMWRGVVVAYIVVALCYFPVALSGYWAFGNDIADDILTQLGRPTWLIATANMMVVVHVTGSYQIYAMAVFDTVERILVRKIHGTLSKMRLVRIVYRSAYILFTAFVACSLPFFNELLGFIGGFALVPTTYFLPCIFWLRIKKPKPFSLSWIVNWIAIVLGVLLMIVATIGGLRNIIKKSKENHYRLFRRYP